MPSQFAQPTQSGLTNDGQKIQFVAIPADQLPYFSFSAFRSGGSFHRGPAGGPFRGRRGRHVAEDTRETKVRTMLTLWMLHLFTFFKTK